MRQLFYVNNVFLKEIIALLNMLEFSTIFVTQILNWHLVLVIVCSASSNLQILVLRLEILLLLLFIILFLLLKLLLIFKLLLLNEDMFVDNLILIKINVIHPLNLFLILCLV